MAASPGSSDPQSQTEPVGAALAGGARVPDATYRLQFNRQFPFAHAAQLADYLRELGLSDVYASPLFKAAPESTHGYDICGFDQLNPALGTPEEFNTFILRLRALELGLLLDMVPNHMGNDLSNLPWLEVLERGPASPYARWFDIDWRPPHTGLIDKVLLPVLEDHYVRVLEAGKLRVLFERGKLWLAYYDRRFPLSPASAADVLDSLGVPADAPGNDPATQTKIDAALRELNGVPGQPRSFDRLHALVQRQHYRLAFWKVGPEEINYRRFFDVTQLVSLRMEIPEVFEATHHFLFCLLREGKITGLRIDHPDGLWDPREYFARLQEGCRKTCPGAHGPTPLYVVTEKILSANERLPADWPVHGTTGYDFLVRVNGLFVESRAEDEFRRIYREFTDHEEAYEEVARVAKRQVLRQSLISEVNSLACRLKRIAGATRRGQDFTYSQLHFALSEVIAAFPVYRTYAAEQSSGLSESELTYVTAAVRAAQNAHPELDPAAFAFLQDLLLLRFPADLEGEVRQECHRFVMRWQQLTGPAAAKGLEDTAFYRFFPLASLNEVGGDPGTFGTSVAEFHQHNLHISRHWPHTLLATATHDTKRGEDVRARLNVLSEMPDAWRQALRRWQHLNSEVKLTVHGRPAPDPHDEYLFYQTLIGSWPPEADSADGLQNLIPRLAEYMLKAIREAKTHTSWTSPNLPYEDAVRQFIHSCLSTTVPNPFLRDARQFQRKLARFGYLNSLAQTLLKMTCPGVPDFYQGAELWDFNLVDPDNRRPVDYTRRRELLTQLREQRPDARSLMPAFLNSLLEDLPSARTKLYVIWRTLQFRRTRRELFLRGEYVPLQIEGAKAGHLCAFARLWDAQAALVIVPRLVFTLLGGKDRLPLGGIWQDTTLRLPWNDPHSSFRNVLTDEVLSAQKGADAQRLALSRVLAQFPVALLERVL